MSKYQDWLRGIEALNRIERRLLLQAIELLLASSKLSNKQREVVQQLRSDIRGEDY